MSMLIDSATVGNSTTLELLDVGQSGRVVRVAGSAEIRNRLLEMGLTPGTSVRVMRVAPLGDPIELQVRGYRLSVRRAEASAVLVEFV